MSGTEYDCGTNYLTSWSCWLLMVRATAPSKGTLSLHCKFCHSSPNVSTNDEALCHRLMLGLGPYVVGFEKKDNFAHM